MILCIWKRIKITNITKRGPETKICKMVLRKVTTAACSLACICFLQLLTHVLSMECFKCPISLSLKECKEKQFVDQCIFGYTTCFTQIKYAAGSKDILNVTKSCVDDIFCERELKATDNHKCEIKDDNNYDCVWCCHQDRCNENSGVQSSKVNPSHTMVVTIVAFVCFYIQHLQRVSGLTMMETRWWKLNPQLSMHLL